MSWLPAILFAQLMTSIEPLLKRGEGYYLEDLFDKAVETFTKAIAAAGTAGAYAARARAYYHMACAALQPMPLNDELANKKWTEQLRQAPEFKNALDDIATALRLDPKCQEAYIGKGLMQSDTDDFYGAVKTFTEYLKHFPGDALVLYYRASAYNETGNPQKALVDLNAAIKISPACSQAYHERATMYLSWKQYKKAMADITRAIKLEPCSVYYTGRVKITACRLAAGASRHDLLKMHRDLTAALQLDPKYAEAYYMRARINLYLEERQAELEDLDKLITLTPADADAYKQRFECNLACGYRQAAAADWRAFRSLEPQDKQ